MDMQFVPALEPGDTAHLVTAQKVINVEVIANGALPEKIKDFGALVAGTWDTDNENTDLELNQYELAQYRMLVLDDILLRFNNLSPTRQWRTSKADFVLGQYPSEPGEDHLKTFLWASSEFFVYEADTPRFDFYCPRASGTSRVKFSGWRFKVREIAVRGKKTLWISGWPTGASA
ncbi:hypothetical protein ES703_10152 [subsurface metagenome]